jgi:hypothetical protein
LRPEVEKLLSEKNLAFDAIYLNTGGDTFNFKCRLFERLIRKLGVSEFTMYDDRYEHLVEFEKWAKTIDCRITIIDVKNKTKKVFK